MADQQSLPIERTHFKELLLAGHFKQLEATAGGGPPKGDPAYEELTCIGYEPQLKRLDAVVHLKQPVGYSGGICTAGSQEYVKFFASTDDGASWTEIGIASFTAWDVPGPLPLEFDVSLTVDLDELHCTKENIVRIRAILSWNRLPGDADDPVVWGNGLDVYVQVGPKTYGTMREVAEELGFAPAGVDLEQIVAFSAGKELTPLELHELYRDTQVPQHRFLLGHVARLLADPIAFDAVASHPQPGIFPGMKGLTDIDGIVKAILDPQGDQTYEQLGCVGLDTGRNELVATIDVKLPSGYGGDLCSDGTAEHVAFWVDWGSGWEYAGTTGVRVHDIASIPADGLQYSAALPFPSALTRRIPCGQGPRTARVRAVLSWSVAPSDTDPYDPPVWGGHLETNVLIPPGKPLVGGPSLQSVGRVPVAAIDGTTGLANTVSPFDARDSPFGGSIEFSGVVVNPDTGQYGGPGIEYRILVSPNGGATYIPMTAPFSVWTHDHASGRDTGPILRTPDPREGWCAYLADTNTPGAHVTVVHNLLGSWQTAGDGWLWIAMEARRGRDGLGTTGWKLIQLDNTAPTATVEIDGHGSCGDFHPGGTISGTYEASDNRAIGGVTMTVHPPIRGSSVRKDVLAATSTTESGRWELTIPTEANPCGYVIDGGVSDRTIVNSGRIGWSGHGYAGFCLRKP